MTHDHAAPSPQEPRTVEVTLPPAKSTDISARTMTILSSVAAMLIFISTNLPDDTPEWASLVLGAVLAGWQVYSGATNSGTGGKRRLP